IMSALERNDLTRWHPKASVLLVHGTKDHTVPYINAENAYLSFKAAGTSVTLIPVNADHSETAISFYLLVLMTLI
ncbi:MAG: hypothetical protein LBV32_08210, partial [Tannerellaceae bacterium]|nr:hypothetical protein [Tannerellaceae bacterium]